jgi:hypothetical protein
VLTPVILATQEAEIQQDPSSRLTDKQFSRPCIEKTHHKKKGYLSTKNKKKKKKEEKKF